MFGKAVCTPPRRGPRSDENESYTLIIVDDSSGALVTLLRYAAITPP
jgi:hypothetical protein